MIEKNAVVKETQKQLVTYPTYSIKQKIKTNLKAIIKKAPTLRGTEFFWPNGLLVNSLERVHCRTENPEVFDVMETYFKEWINKGQPMKNADYAINGYSLIYVYNKTNESQYRQAIEVIVNYLKSLNKTSLNSIPYRPKNENIVLIDNLGMVSPFLCRYYSQFQDPEALELGIAQLENFLLSGMDKDTGLPYHGFDAKSKMKLGIVGWGRAMGWLLMGLVDSLEYIPESHSSYSKLRDEYISLVNKTLRYQKVDGNFSWQITLREGYSDTSSTSMINYAIQRGINLGYLSKDYGLNVDKSIDALLKQTQDGKVFNCSAECRGISMYPQKFGNYPWSQGPTTSLIAIR